MVTLTINGKEITTKAGTLILDAAREAGYEIPTFCYQADLMGVGSCRMCLVEIEGQRKLQPSCITPVVHGMSVQTDTPTVVSARAGVLEFLLSNHGLDCPVCDKGGECELQDAVYKYGPRTGRFAESKHRFHDKDYILSPVIVKNSNRCVQCLKCVRVCSEVVGVGVLGAIGRGHEQEETSFLKTFLNCDHDGNCIEVCPVGCFMRLPYRYKTRPWDLKGADTICPYCATGCRMVIEERDKEVVRSRAQLGVGINSETLCARGRFGYDVINSPERISTPLVRKYGKLEPVSWPEALDYIKDNLAPIKGDRVGGIASPRLTNEELYLFQKFLRTVIESPNIDSTTRWTPEAVENFIAATGMTEGGVSIFDLMEAETLIVAGTQLSEENPVVDYIVRRISGSNHMNVVIASPRAMKLDSSANLSIRHTPGEEGALFDALTLSMRPSIMEAFDAIPGAGRLKDGSVEDMAAAAGVTTEQITRLTEKIAASRTISIIAGTELLRYPGGSSGLSLFKEALKAAGKEVRILPVLDRCNQRGAWEMGVLPGTGPGYGGVERRGLGFHAMIDAAADRELDALYIVGKDVIGGYYDEAYARDALTGLKFLLVQDMFMTETARVAHCVLPGASFAEKEGTFTNQEGRVQVIRRLFAPRGKALSDLEIIASIGRTFAGSFAPAGRPRSMTVFEEIRDEIPMYTDVSLRFNNKKNTANQLDNREALLQGSANRLSPAVPPAPARSPGSGFMLTTGNHLFHSGRFSLKSRILTGLQGEPIVELSTEDAGALGLSTGDRVRVKNERYEALLTVRTKKGTKKGVAFIPENFVDAPALRFFSPGTGVPRVEITKV